LVIDRLWPCRNRKLAELSRLPAGGREARGDRLPHWVDGCDNPLVLSVGQAHLQSAGCRIEVARSRSRFFHRADVTLVDSDDLFRTGLFRTAGRNNEEELLGLQGSLTLP